MDDADSLDANKIAGILEDSDVATINSLSGKLIFRNALRGFIREQSLEEAGGENKVIYAMDTVEIYSWVNPEDHAIKNFAFGNLIDPIFDIGKNELLNHSNITAEQVLFKSKNNFVIFDGHVEECRALFSRYDLRSISPDNIKESIRKNDLKSLDSAYQKVASLIENSEDFLLSNEGAADIEKIMNLWVSKFSDIILEVSHISNRIEYFNRRANYMSVFGKNRKLFESAIIRSLDGRINHKAFERHIAFAETQKKMLLETERLRSLLVKISKHDNRPKSDLNLAIYRDVETLVLAQCINDFFEICKIPTRIEFITRSHRLHLLSLLVPYSSLRVNIRHPMFLPKVHNLPSSVLDNLGDISRRIDHYVGTLLKLEVEDNTFSVETQKRETNTYFKSLVIDAISQMTSVIVSGRTIETSDQNKKYGTAGEAAMLNKLNKVSNFVLDDLTKEDGNFERIITSKISDKIMSSTGEFYLDMKVGEQGFEDKAFENEKFTIFINPVEKDPFASDESQKEEEMMSFRILGLGMPRLFFIHGARLKNWLLDKTTINPSEVESIEAISVIITAKELFKFVNIREQVKYGQPPNLDHIESGLVRGVMYASLGWYDVAATIISPYLSFVTNEIRRRTPLRFGSQVEIFSDQVNANLALAYKELFLLRHYCERSSRRVIKNDRKNWDINFTEDHNIKNILRAQRDLDLAVYMSEEYIRLSSVQDIKRESISVWDKAISTRRTSRFALDVRLNLIHTAAALELSVEREIKKKVYEDQFSDKLLTIISDKNSSTEVMNFYKNSIATQHTENNQLDDRHEAWLTAGTIKSLEIEIARISIEREALEKHDTTRHFREERLWAYFEAHGMSVLSTMFISAVIFKTYPKINAVANPYSRVSYEQFLVFKNWRSWFKQLIELDRHYTFEIRTVPLIKIFLKYFDHVDEIRVKLNSPSSRLKRNKSYTLKTLNRYTDEFEKEISSFFENKIRQEQIEIPDGLTRKLNPFILSSLREWRARFQKFENQHF